MKKIICICICISLVFGCGKPNSVVKREANVSAVSIPQNQTNPEKQYSINEETNLQNLEAPKQSVTEKLKSWISEHKTATGVIIALAVVSIVAVIIGVRMHSKSSGWQEQIKRLTDENTQLKTKHPAPKSNQLKTNTATAETQVDDLKIENEQIEPLKQELNKAKEDVNKLTEENKQLKTENAQIANLEQTINNANLQAQQLKEENETLQKKNEQIEPLNTENDSIKRDNAILLNTIQKMEDDKQSLIQDYEKAMEKPTLSKSADASFFDFTAEPVLSQSQPVEGIQLKAEKVDVETETDAGITNEFPMVVNEQVFTNAMQTIQQELTKYEGEITNRQSLLEHRVLILQNKLSELKPQ